MIDIQAFSENLMCGRGMREIFATPLCRRGWSDKIPLWAWSAW